jgi:phage head maturation protease
LPAQRETGFKVGTIKVQIPQNPRTKNFVEAVKCSQVKKFSLCFQPGRDGLLHTQPVSTFQKVETGCFSESQH